MAIPEPYLLHFDRLNLKSIPLPNLKTVWEVSQDQSKVLTNLFGPIQDRIPFSLASADALMFGAGKPVLIVSVFGSGLVILSRADLHYFLSKLRIHGFSKDNSCWYLSLEREETLSLLKSNEYRLLPTKLPAFEVYELISSRAILLCSPSRRAMWFKSSLDFQVYADWAGEFELNLQ